MGVLKLFEINKITVLIIALMICGCSVVPIKKSEFNLPDQAIDTQSQQENYRVVFFNTSNPILYPLSGTINIKLNQKHVATLKIGRYVQVYIPPGEYDLYLDHWDMITWDSEYKLIVNNNDTYVKVFAKLTSTGHEIVKDLPEGFQEDYWPGYED